MLAIFQRGSQTTATCPEYTGCSRERCGRREDAYTTVIDPDCEAARERNQSVDCPPTELVDQQAVEDFDRCDTECLEDTRDVCALHTELEQLGGNVRVGKLNGDDLSFYWAGKVRTESLSDLGAPECSGRHSREQCEYVERWSRMRTSSSQMTAPPTAESTEPQCPLAPVSE